MDKITGDERMIDTNKYEGHTEGLWCWKDGNIVRKAIGNTPLTDDAGLYLIADKHLIADAPLLLEEVKRLREQVECSKDEHEWELDDYLDGDPNKPIRIVETCAACGLVREMIE